jgi:hypothetical protein
MDTTVIEVNGVKLEVDLRTAKRIDTLRVGDRVKVLIKNDYSSECAVKPGVVVGFEPFEMLPTIIVAYMEIDYSGSNLKFLHFNKASKGTEVIKSIDNDHLDVDKVRVTAMFDKQIEQKQRELEDLEAKKTFFLAEFSKYWEFEPITA